MGNEPLCGRDNQTDHTHSQYVICGREPEFRNSTTINIVNHVPVVTGSPLDFQKQETFRKVEKSAADFCQNNGLQNSFVPVVARIIAYGHSNIFQAYRKLPQLSKYDFLEEVRFVQLDFLDSLYHRFMLKKHPPKPFIKPPSNMIKQKNIELSKRVGYEDVGRKILLKREVAILFLCAGSSSRFMHQNKFLSPLEIKQKKSILEIMLNRVRKNLGIPGEEKISLPIVFACSTENRREVEDFLKENNYCGFDASKIRYLQVPGMPVIDKNGKICITFEFKIIERPCGTLKCVEEMLGSGVYHFLKAEGITYLHIVGTQNLAQRPVDPFLLGYLYCNKLDLLGKCTNPAYPTEQFTRYASTKDGRTYLAQPKDLLQAKIPESTIQKFVSSCPIAMNSVMCRLSELRSMVKNYENSMFLSRQFRPFYKNENYYDYEKEKPVVNEGVVVFEKDLGNLFTCTAKHHLIKVPRSEFIPVLGRSGNYSLKQASNMLMKYYDDVVSLSTRSEF